MFVKLTQYGVRKCSQIKHDEIKLKGSVTKNQYFIISWFIKLFNTWVQTISVKYIFSDYDMSLKKEYQTKHDEIWHEMS